MSDDLFDHNEESFEEEIASTEGDQPKLDDYVGEGKKYRDNDAVAKALSEKDRFIEQLKRENAEARDSIRERISMEEFLNQVKASKTPQSPSERVTTPAERDEKAAAVTPEDIERIIATREATQKREANLREVERRLQEAYGRNWRQEVQKRASELEVSTTYLTKVAGDSPKMFFQTLGVTASTQPSETFTPPPRGAVSAPLTSRSTKDYKYFQEQRKVKGEDWYFSASTRQEIWNELKAQGEEKFGLPK